jgi:uncharacterized protein (DUF1501 family)
MSPFLTPAAAPLHHAAGTAAADRAAPSPGRRRLVQSMLAGALLGPLAGGARLAVAAPGGGENRLVLVILRGGMDGLHAAPMPADPAWATARGPLAQAAAGALPLDDGFALHPLLPQLHAGYGRGELLLLHATGLPYRERSHFDAQQVLESGGSRPYELATGWLARALPHLGGAGRGSRSAQAATGATAATAATAPGTRLQAVALQTALPLVLRGPAAVDSWAPSVLPEPEPDLVARIAAMYAADPALAQSLNRARELRADPAMAANPSMGEPGAGNRASVALARKAAEFLQRGAQVAVLELGGWDSHVNQAAPNGALANSLRTLDAMLAALREDLLPGDTWGRTAVLVATEFGREVAGNGTGGTDHGSGGAAFLLGGAVHGGRVVTDWPGLAPAQLAERRDLRITTDLRAVLKPLLADHLGVARTPLEREVLPGSAAVAPLRDLLRG